MRSIKPGRGPSMMGGVASIFGALFGVFWTLTALSMGAPIFFCLFGVFFIVMAIVQAIYNFKNATSKNRYSAFDITDNQEEPDPFNQYFGESNYKEESFGFDENKGTSKFCPYCGAEVEKDYKFCNSCGKELP